ncbi:MAG: DUF4163 domain-containing protein [Lachnospiraceae bacterium]|nr:DUF4163 domain-containing protein [Lachnospiraceae bacterium]
MKRRVKCGIKSVITIAIIGIALCVRMKSSKSNEEISIIGQVYSNEKQYNEILINYPQLQGLDDSVKEKKINDLIKKDVLGILEKETLFKENNLAMHLDYEIKFLNENIISIFYEGWSGAVHNGNTLPPFCVATTIDMQQERIVALKEIIIDFDALGRLLLADKFENISTWEGGKSFQKMSNSGVGSDELIELLMKEDYEVADDYIQWYTDGNNLVVVYCKRYYEEYSTDVAVVEYIMYDNFVNSIAGENQIEYKAEVTNYK